jgi:hypothetical protein
MDNRHSVMSSLTATTTTTSTAGDDAVLSGTNFTTSDISLGKVKVNSNGGKNVPLYNAKVRGIAMISTPLMLTWGWTENDFDGTGKKTYDISLQFPSSDYMTEETEAFLMNMKALEAYVKEQAVLNSKEWFNKAKMSPEVIDALWTPMVRHPKDKETGEPDFTRAPTLRVKIPFWDGVFNIEIYDVEGNPLFPGATEPADLLPSKAQVATVIRCGGVWLANGKFGMTWRLQQAVVKPQRAALQKGKCYVRMTDSDKAVLTTQNAAAEEVTANVEVEDSDDDGIEEDEPQVEVTPTPAAPTKTKKRVVKKKV